MYFKSPDEFFYKDYQGTTARFEVDEQTGESRWISLRQADLEFILMPETAEVARAKGMTRRVERSRVRRGSPR
jgi:hypothetical protein